jgi:nucleoside-diphosphate-sugar epimerase
MEVSHHEPVNIGNPDEWTMLELAKHLLAMVDGSSSRIEFRPLPTDDPKQRRPDLTKARALLQWEPKVRVDDGLRKTVAWFRANGGQHVG